uniref:Integral membrane protein n=1 Tax=Streptomyces sp. NBC_00049 TaxID=2903617 RepID=A0AAU2JLQ2_9ACTN
MPAKPIVTPRRLMAVTAATLIAAAATPATLAYAIPSATVSPTAVAQGGRVGLDIRGCGTKVARVTSTAFSEVRLNPGNLEATNLFGSATVYSNASPGTHRVLFECGGPGGERVTVSLQVSTGAARGGTGGSIGSMSPGHIAVGGALAAGALGAGVWLMRRRAAA